MKSVNPMKWVKWMMYGLFLKNNDAGNKTNE